MPKATPKPKRALASALEASTTPPDELTPQQTLARLIKAEGNHIYSVILPRAKMQELELPTDSEPSATAAGESGSVPDRMTQEDHYVSLVELMPALRSTVFLRRNGYVLVDCDRELLGGRENKIVGIIVGVVLGGKMEKEWRRMVYWPKEFGKTKAWDDSDNEEGPKMPESEDDTD